MQYRLVNIQKVKLNIFCDILQGFISRGGMGAGMNSNGKQPQELHLIMERISPFSFSAQELLSGNGEQLSIFIFSQELLLGNGEQLSIFFSLHTIGQICPSFGLGKIWTNVHQEKHKKTIQQVFFDSSDMSGFPSRKDMDQNHSDSNPICEVQGGPVPGWILDREFFTLRTSPLPLGLITFIQLYI